MLLPFNARRVRAGEPLTAQAWNEIVDALDNATEFLAATQHAVRVQITTLNLDYRTVRVTVDIAAGQRVEGVRPVTNNGHHYLTGLPPGQHTLRAEAHGYQVKTQVFTVDDRPDQLVEVVLEPLATPVMPDLFAAPFPDALALLQAAGVSVTVYDFAGQTVTSAKFADYAESLVLAHSPPAGALIGAQGVVLGITLSARPQDAVQVPDLTGFTEAEARRTLSQLGLTLGTVTKLKNNDNG